MGSRGERIVSGFQRRENCQWVPEEGELSVGSRGVRMAKEEAVDAGKLKCRGSKQGERVCA